MKSEQPPQFDPALRQALREWKIKDALPPRFGEQVWQRIAREEVQSSGPNWMSVLSRIARLVIQPRLAMTGAAILVAAGLLGGYWQARLKSARTSEELGTRYVQIIIPFQGGSPMSSRLAMPTDVKRALVLLAAALGLGAAAYLGAYHAGMADMHRLTENPTPELAWLKEEFHLSDAEFKRISAMHEDYLAGCAERCRHIDETNRFLRQLLSTNTAVTPEIQSVLAQVALLKAQCQEKMLQQFFEISKTMPPAQGKRYLAWVQSQTVLADAHSQMSPTQTAPSPGEPPMPAHHHHPDTNAHD